MQFPLLFCLRLSTSGSETNVGVISFCRRFHFKLARFNQVILFFSLLVNPFSITLYFLFEFCSFNLYHAENHHCFINCHQFYTDLKTWRHAGAIDSFVKVTYSKRVFLNITFDWQSSLGSTPATPCLSLCELCALS